MTQPDLTDEHRRALLWLVPGQVCSDPPREIVGALQSLHQDHPDLINVGHKMDRKHMSSAYALTRAGVAARAAILRQDD
jgi:hypothetical protein